VEAGEKPPGTFQRNSSRHGTQKKEKGVNGEPLSERRRHLPKVGVWGIVGPGTRRSQKVSIHNGTKRKVKARNLLKSSRQMCPENEVLVVQRYILVTGQGRRLHKSKKKRTGAQGRDCENGFDQRALAQ